MVCLCYHALALVSSKGYLCCRDFASTQSPASGGSIIKVQFWDVAHELPCTALLLCWSCPGYYKRWGQMQPCAGTAKTILGTCMLHQKLLIPWAAPVNLFLPQAYTESYSCPKETCGTESVSERLSNSVHNCRDLSVISNSLCRKGRLFFPLDHVVKDRQNLAILCKPSKCNSFLIWHRFSSQGD